MSSPKSNTFNSNPSDPLNQNTTRLSTRMTTSFKMSGESLFMSPTNNMIDNRSDSILSTIQEEESNNIDQIRRELESRGTNRQSLSSSVSTEGIPFDMFNFGQMRKSEMKRGNSIESEIVGLSDVLGSDACHGEIFIYFSHCISTPPLLNFLNNIQISDIFKSLLRSWDEGSLIHGQTAMDLFLQNQQSRTNTLKHGPSNSTGELSSLSGVNLFTPLPQSHDSFFISFQSKTARFIAIFQIFIAIYTVLFAPYHVSYQRTYDTEIKLAQTGLFVYDALNTIYIILLIINLNTTCVDWSTGVEYYDRSMIYKKNKAQNWLDFISIACGSFPALFFNKMDVSRNILPVSILLVISAVFRLHRLIKFPPSLYWYTSRDIFTLIQIFAWLIILSVLIGCFWWSMNLYFIGNAYDHIFEEFGPVITDRKEISEYLASIRYGVYSLTGRSRRVYSNFDLILNIFFGSLGVVVIAVLFANFQVVVSRKYYIGREIQDVLNRVEHTVKSLRLPPSQVRTIMDYMQVVLVLNRQFSHQLSKLVEELPSELSANLKSEIYGRLLYNSKLLRKLNILHIDQVVNNWLPEFRIYQPGNVVFSRDQKLRNIYFIVRGGLRCSFRASVANVDLIRRTIRHSILQGDDATSRLLSTFQFGRNTTDSVNYEESEKNNNFFIKRIFNSMRSSLGLFSPIVGGGRSSQMPRLSAQSYECDVPSRTDSDDESGARESKNQAKVSFFRRHSSKIHPATPSTEDNLRLSGQSNTVKHRATTSINKKLPPNLTKLSSLISLQEAEDTLNSLLQRGESTHKIDTEYDLMRRKSNQSLVTLDEDEPLSDDAPITQSSFKRHSNKTGSIPTGKFINMRNSTYLNKNDFLEAKRQVEEGNTSRHNPSVISSHRQSNRRRSSDHQFYAIFYADEVIGDTRENILNQPVQSKCRSVSFSIVALFPKHFLYRLCHSYSNINQAVIEACRFEEMELDMFEQLVNRATKLT